MQWYYALDGQRIGPVPHVELERLIQNRTLNGEALIWRQGMDQWKSLADVQTRDPALFAKPAPADMPPLPETADATDRVDTAAEVERDGREVEAGAATEEMRYAGFWQRAGAFVFDSILYGVGLIVLVNIVALKFFPEIVKLNEAILASGGSWKYQPTPDELVLMVNYTAVVALVAMVWALAYDLFFILKLGATPGKLVFGMRVVDANGAALGFGRVLVRCLARWLVAFTLGIGYLIVAFDEQKRALHDFFCSTRVIKKR